MVHIFNDWVYLPGNCHHENGWLSISNWCWRNGSSGRVFYLLFMLGGWRVWRLMLVKHAWEISTSTQWRQLSKWHCSCLSSQFRASRRKNHCSESVLSQSSLQKFLHSCQRLWVLLDCRLTELRLLSQMQVSS